MVWLFLSHKNKQEYLHACLLVLGFLQILAGITVLILLDFPACKLYNFFVLNKNQKCAVIARDWVKCYNSFVFNHHFSLPYLIIFFYPEMVLS